MEFKLPAVAPAKRRRRSPKADYAAFPLLSAPFSQEFGLLGSSGQSVGFRARFQRRLRPGIAIPGFFCEFSPPCCSQHPTFPLFPPIYCGFRCSHHTAAPLRIKGPNSAGERELGHGKSGEIWESPSSTLPDENPNANVDFFSFQAFQRVGRQK